jgi:transketolase
MSAPASRAADSPRPMTAAQLDQLSINCIRTLSIDAVQQAKSGHPGTPMALAPLVYTLWNRVMRFDPQDPIWPNRDRFVLSNGHASMLLWSVLHLSGTRAVNADYERLGQPAVSLDDIRHFRQFGSKAPGHPEYHWVSGVEATTRASRTAWAWRSPRRGSPRATIVRASRSSSTASMRCAATAT